MKKCYNCKLTKKNNYYHLNNTAKDGLELICKKCNQLKKKLYLQKYGSSPRDKERIRQMQPHKIAQRAKYDLTSRGKLAKLKAGLWHNYRITLDEFNIRLNKQHNVCAICGHNGIDKRTKRLFVDHCHKTYKFRGLLCRHCNSLIGYAKDSIDILLKTVEYLKENS